MCVKNLCNLYFNLMGDMQETSLIKTGQTTNAVTLGPVPPGCDCVAALLHPIFFLPSFIVSPKVVFSFESCTYRKVVEEYIGINALFLGT